VRKVARKEGSEERRDGWREREGGTKGWEFLYY
jgi:hypothetical protein